MPITNLTYGIANPDGTHREGPEALHQRGPVLQVEVSILDDLAEELQERGEEIPAPASGFALIDTGATTSAIDQSVVEYLEMQPVDTAEIGTAGGRREMGVYGAQFSFPGSQIRDIGSQQILGVDLEGHTLGTIFRGGPPTENREGQEAELVALIGRDILAHTILFYNGPKGMLTLGI